MYTVNVWDKQGIRTIECASLEDALSTASEAMIAGNTNVTILDRDKKSYTEADIDLLIQMMKAEQKPKGAKASPEAGQK